MDRLVQSQDPHANFVEPSDVRREVAARLREIREALGSVAEPLSPAKWSRFIEDQTGRVISYKSLERYSDEEEPRLPGLEEVQAIADAAIVKDAKFTAQWIYFGSAAQRAAKSSAEHHTRLTGHPTKKKKKRGA